MNSNNVIDLINEHKITVFVVLTLVIITVFVGFSSEQVKVTECRATVTRYVTAEYSELCLGCDYWEKDYWSEPASIKHTVITINSELYSSSQDTNLTVMGSVYYPPYPEHDKSLSQEHHFDNFQKHSETNLLVSTDFLGVTDSFSEGVNKMFSCTEKLGSFVVVNTWFGISYSSDF